MSIFRYFYKFSSFGFRIYLQPGIEHMYLHQTVIPDLDPAVPELSFRHINNSGKIFALVNVVHVKPEPLPDTILGENDPYQVFNGDFESGDLTGWTLLVTDGETDFGYVSGQDVFWKNADKPYNKDGRFLFSGIEDVMGNLEAAQGTLTSTTFTVGGCGYITFKLGGGYNPECYIEIVDAGTGTTLAKYHNDNADTNEGRMFQYKADLTEYMGRDVYIRVVDNASSAWGCLAVDSFITHYEAETDLPEAILAENKI